MYTSSEHTLVNGAGKEAFYTAMTACQARR